MAANENPTTKFQVDISELKAGIQESNRLIRLANSEFKAAASGMDNWADSTEGLEAKIKQLNTIQEQEERKLVSLQEQYKRVAEEQGENSRGAQELAIKINNQRAAVNKVAGELSTYENRLGLVEEAHKNAERSGNSFEDELRNLEKALNNAGDAAEEASDDGFTVFKGAIADLAANAISTAIGSIRDFIGSMMELPEATKEFRTVFGAAMQSAEDSAVGVDGAKKAFEEFYKVAADEGQAAEATSHLVDLAKSEEDLQKALDGVTGAWVEYGDSISIEGLAEAASETYKTGTLTGQMADAINWAGESEEEFQKKLEECSSEQERQQLVVDTLNRLYGDNAKAYRESNDSILSTNEANLKLLESQSEIATTIEPLTAAWTNLKASALDALAPAIEWLVIKFQAFAQYLRENKEVADVLKGVVITLATAFGILASALLISNLISAVQKAFALLNLTMLANPAVLIASLIAGLVVAVITLWKTSDTFRNFWKTTWESMKETCSEGVKIIKDAFNTFIGWIKNNWQSILLFLINPFAGLFNYFYQNNTKFREFVDKAVYEISLMPGKVWTWFLQVIQKVVDLKNQLVTKGTEAAQGLWDAIVNKIKALPDEIKKIGGDIVEGLWNGINDKVDWITEKVKTFGNSVMNALKDFFGIKSPSKEASAQIGVPIGQGIGAGLASSVQSAVSSAKDALSDVGKPDWLNTGRFADTNTSKSSSNTYNFIQNNNSPKSLSRIDIYRDTKNLLRTAGV